MVFANPRYVQHPTNAHMPALPPHPPFQYPRRIVNAWNAPANAPAKDPNNDNGVCDCCQKIHHTLPTQAMGSFSNNPNLPPMPKHRLLTFITIS